MFRNLKDKQALYIISAMAFLLIAIAVIMSLTDSATIRFLLAVCCIAILIVGLMISIRQFFKHMIDEPKQDVRNEANIVE